MASKFETIAVFGILAGSIGTATWLAGPTLLQLYRDDQQATALGFSGASDRADAKAAGFTDGTAWRDHLAKTEADKRLRAEEEKRAAEREAAARAKRLYEEREARTISRPKIEIARWEKGGFGSVGIVDVKITNTSSRGWIRDIKVECSFYGKSGTMINTRSATVYETIRPKQTHVARKLNLGFIDQQSSSASCSFIAASVASGMLLADF